MRLIANHRVQSCKISPEVPYTQLELWVREWSKFTDGRLANFVPNIQQKQTSGGIYKCAT